MDHDDFEMLLAWLDKDRERAGEKYEEIRIKLIKVFAHRGCTNAEELADKTIDRVARKVRQIASTYVGDPSLYFYGVAQNVFKEHIKRRPTPQPPAQIDLSDEREKTYECLYLCLETLDPLNRRLILQYYEGEKQAKIELRKELAKQYKVSPYLLRVRTQRLRSRLKKCVFDCLKQLQGE